MPVEGAEGWVTLDEADEASAGCPPRTCWVCAGFVFIDVGIFVLPCFLYVTKHHSFPEFNTGNTGVSMKNFRKGTFNIEAQLKGVGRGKTTS